MLSYTKEMKKGVKTPAGKKVERLARITYPLVSVAEVAETGTNRFKVARFNSDEECTQYLTEVSGGSMLVVAQMVDIGIQAMTRTWVNNELRLDKVLAKALNSFKVDIDNLVTNYIEEYREDLEANGVAPHDPTSEELQAETEKLRNRLLKRSKYAAVAKFQAQGDEAIREFDFTEIEKLLETLPGWCSGEEDKSEEENEESEEE